MDEQLINNKRLKVINNWNDIFVKKFKLISDENPIYADFGISKNNRYGFGLIDYIAKYGKDTYIIEEDITNDFNKWHWSKVLAYRAGFILDNTIVNPCNIKCAVFLNEKLYNYRLRNILLYLRIEYFFFKNVNSNLECIASSIDEILKKFK